MTANRKARTEGDTAISRVVGQNLKRLRAARGLSQRRLVALAQEKGFRLNHASYSRIELGRNAKGGLRAVTVDELVAYATVLEVRPERLLEEPTCLACCGAPPAGFACRECGAES
jgi:transcriptional regulator with XRE-family HTH domain